MFLKNLDWFCCSNVLLIDSDKFYLLPAILCGFGILLFFSQSFQKSVNMSLQFWCFNIDVFSFQHPEPLGSFFIWILTATLLWSEIDVGFALHVFVVNFLVIYWSILLCMVLSALWKVNRYFYGLFFLQSSIKSLVLI